MSFPHQVKQGPLLPKVHFAWGVGRKIPLEFASGEKGEDKRSAEASNLRRTVGALCFVFSWCVTRVP